MEFAKDQKLSAIPTESVFLAGVCGAIMVVVTPSRSLPFFSFLFHAILNDAPATVDAPPNAIDKVPVFIEDSAWSDVLEFHPCAKPFKLTIAPAAKTARPVAARIVAVFF